MNMLRNLIKHGIRKESFFYNELRTRLMQRYRSTGVQEYRSIEVQGYRGKGV